MTQVDDVLFTQMSKVRRDERGVVCGETVFGGVAYDFERLDDNDTVHADARQYRLTPVDDSHGPVIISGARFRDGERVHWFTFYAPELKDRHSSRERFAGFLDRVRDQTATTAHWCGFCITHYADTELESIRSRCVDMFMDRGDMEALSDDERDTLLAWSNELRTSVDEPSDAPKDRASSFDNGNSTAGPR
ncbi:MAG: hypothetical protein AAF802_29960 [Planctomycetota bacterium]